MSDALGTLRRDIAAAVRRTLVEIRRKHAKKALRGFALCTDDDAVTLFPAATFRSEAKGLSPLEFDFNPNEWEIGRGLASKAWEPVSSALSDDDVAGTTKKRLRVFVDALKDVRDEGGFGSAADRRDLVLMVVSTDPSEELNRLAERWLKELSSPEVSKRFRKLVADLENPAVSSPVGELLGKLDAATRELFAVTEPDEYTHRDYFSERMKKAPDWFGAKGASEDAIAKLEKRLGEKLPPSYRTFLAASNGWRWVNQVRRLAPAEKVEWLPRKKREWVESF